MRLTHSRPIAYAMLLALIACIIWAGNFVMARGVHAWAPPIQLAFWRWTCALIFILPIAWPHLRTQLPLARKAWRVMLVMGIIGVGVFNTLVYIAAHSTNANNIAIISATAPLWTLLFAIALKQERATKPMLLGMGLALIGAFIVILKGSFSTLLTLNFAQGDFILCFSAMCWGVYCVMLKYRPSAMKPSVFLFTITVIGLVALLPFALWEGLTYGWMPVTTESGLLVLYLGVGASIIAWFGWNHAVGILGAVRTGLIYYTIPLFGAIMAILFLEEPVRLYHLASFACIFSGIIIANRIKKPRML